MVELACSAVHASPRLDVAFTNALLSDVALVVVELAKSFANLVAESTNLILIFVEETSPGGKFALSFANFLKALDRLVILTGFVVKIAAIESESESKPLHSVALKLEELF